MYGRLDLPKNQTGLARCYNFLVTPQGVAENRGGSRFIAPTKDNGRAWLKTFVRPNGQGVLVELGTSYTRLYSAGNALLTDVAGLTISSIALDADDPAVFTTSTTHGLSVDDEVSAVGITLVNSDAVGEHVLNQFLNKLHYVATAPTTTTFTLKDEQGNAVRLDQLYVSPYDGLLTGGKFIVGAGPSTEELVTPYTYSHARQVKSAQFVDDLAMCHNIYPPVVLRRVSDNNWSHAGIFFNEGLTSIADLDGTAEEIDAMVVDDPRTAYKYVVTSLTIDGEESDVSNELSLDNVLRILGNENRLNWTAVPGVWRYNVYKNTGSGVFGIIGYTDSSSFTDDNITPDMTLQPAEVLVSFNSPGDYPGVTAYHAQRAWFANTLNEPQSFWTSGLASFSYFRASFPPQDDQAFTYKLSSLRAAPILYAVPLNDLLFFTGAGVFKVFPVGGPVAPQNMDSKVVAAVGASPFAEPQAMSQSVVFPAAGSAHVHALSSDGSENGYASTDLSIIAPQFADGYTWVQTTSAQAPYPLWYGLRSDGKIIALTFLAAEQVYAWHQHELPGGFAESIAVVPEGANDVLYAVVRRTVNGSTVRYIERIEPRYRTGDQAEAFFLDCGKTYRGTAMTTIMDLGHLEGKEVYALADGRPMGPFTVTSAEITLDDTADIVHVGLAYDAELQTLALATDQVAGFGVGVEKNISAVHVRFRTSALVEAGTNFTDMRPMVPEAEELLGDVPVLHDGVKQIDIDGEWSPDASVCIRQSQPLPATIAGVAVDYVSAA